ncbi:MAG TPA: hypothetical protein QF873_02840 [Patescibacteria group bacterium]|nr:hypothetical protein [Patescibacteria group bacterium]
MLKNKKHNQVVGPILIGGIILAVGLALMFLNSTPEYLKIVTADGAMTVAGDFPSDLDVTVQLDEGSSQGSFTAAVEKVYSIGPDGVALPALVALRMPTRQRELDTAYKIGFFDTERSLWVPLETRRDDELGYFEAATNHFSSWTLLAAPRVVVGEVDREAVLLDALASMPPGTQEYDVDLAYSTVDGDYVLLEESVLMGRCEDPPTVQGTDVTTMTDRAATLDIDGEDIDGTVRVIVSWEVGAGCANFLESSTGQEGFRVL